MSGVTRSFRHFAGMSIRAHLLLEVRPFTELFIASSSARHREILGGPQRGPLRRIINRVFFVDISLSLSLPFFTRRPQPINLYDWSRVVPTRNLRETRLIKFRAERCMFFFFRREPYPFPSLYESFFFYGTRKLRSL